MPSQEEIEAQVTRLKVYRQNLSLYLFQRAQLGGEAFVTPGIANGIIDSRHHISVLKRVLRDWGIIIEDRPDDENPSAKEAEIVSREVASIKEDIEYTRNNKLIEDMCHHIVWHHHDSRDAKGSTWSAIASEAGIFNYDYKFLVYFLKLKNKNNGWQILGTTYTPVPIPSMQDFIEIMEVRLSHIKQVIDTYDISLKWNWPSTWGYVPWNGPIIHTNSIQKLPDEAYIYVAQREYAQTNIAIEQYKVVLGT